MFVQKKTHSFKVHFSILCTVPFLQGRDSFDLEPRNDWDATDASQLSVVVKLFFEDELCMPAES